MAVKGSDQCYSSEWHGGRRGSCVPRHHRESSARNRGFLGTNVITMTKMPPHNICGIKEIYCAKRGRERKGKGAHDRDKERNEGERD